MGYLHIFVTQLNATLKVEKCDFKMISDRTYDLQWQFPQTRSKCRSTFLQMWRDRICQIGPILSLPRSHKPVPLNSTLALSCFPGVPAAPPPPPPPFPIPGNSLIDALTPPAPYSIQRDMPVSSSLRLLIKK